MSTARLLPEGIYTPLPTFFKDDEELDLEALASHTLYTAKAGTIPVLSGSMGEAIHLSRAERKALIQTARRVLDSNGLLQVPIITGVGASSTRESIALAKDAADAGADFAMVIPPGYYAGPLQAANGEAIRRFFVDIAAASPIPVVLYNFPAVSGGIDLDSDLIVDVVKRAPNVVGVKLTCASVGKLTRIAALVHESEFVKQYPRKTPGQSFRIIDGYIDILLPSVAVGAAGAISGLPNFAPKTCVRLWKLCHSAPGTKEHAEARELQSMIALADGLAVKIGIAGMKLVLSRLFGYGRLPRRPLMPMDEAAVHGIIENPLIQKLLDEEARMQ